MNDDHDGPSTLDQVRDDMGDDNVKVAGKLETISCNDTKNNNHVK